MPSALRATRKGGVVVCAGIHMSDLPAMPYSLLWGERSVRSVANLTRADGSSLGATSGETISKQYGWSKWRETLVRTMYNATRYHM